MPDGSLLPRTTAVGEVVHRASPGRVANTRTFVLSDATLDRHGTVLDPAGWVLDNFKRNPIAFFGHDNQKIVGQWQNIRTENSKLLADFKDLEPGTSLIGDEVTKLIDQGVLRATSVGFKPLAPAQFIDPKNPERGFLYPKNELLEASLVGLPSNPSALHVARSMGLSDETMSLVFGEHAEERRRDISTGEHADNRTANGIRPSGTRTLLKVNKMATLSERIQDVQHGINEKSEKRDAIVSADILDVEALKAINVEIELAEDALSALMAAESGNAARAASSAGLTPSRPTSTALALTTQEQRQQTGLPVPAINRRPLGFPQQQLSKLDLLVRAITARGVTYFGQGDKSLERVLDERYPGHEATWMMTRADQTVGTTTVSGWAAELVTERWQGFMEALDGVSVYPQLRDRGMGLSFDGNGTVNVPGVSAGGAGGGFFGEGAPIRVGRITTTEAALTAFQMGVIIPFTRKLAQQSTPSIEAVVRNRIPKDTAAILDPILMDATSASSVRPAGLLNGVAATATGAGGADMDAVIADFKALTAPFYAANAADSIVVLMNPAQGLSLSMMPNQMGDFGWFTNISNRLAIIESTHVTAGRLIAIRTSDFVTALGDGPEFDVSEQATIHMEDTTPLEIVSGTGPTTADPVRSLWQTNSMGVRMIMDISWKMMRSGMVQWIDSTSW